MVTVHLPCLVVVLWSTTSIFLLLSTALALSTVSVYLMLHVLLKLFMVIETDPPVVTKYCEDVAPNVAKVSIHNLHIHTRPRNVF